MNKIAQLPNCLIVKHNFKFRIISQLKSIIYYIIQFCKGTISYYIIVSLNILINTNQKKNIVLLVVSAPQPKMSGSPRSLGKTKCCMV